MANLPRIPDRPDGSSGQALKNLPDAARDYVEDLERRAGQFHRIGEVLLQQETMPDLAMQVEAILKEGSETWRRDERWVIAAADREGVILKSDGSWVEASPETLDIADTMTHSEGANQRLPKGATLTRADMVGDVPVTAEIHSDDRVVDHLVDIRIWLASASPDDILALESDEWRGGYGADKVALDLEAAGHPACRDLFDYLARSPRMMNGDTVGFEVGVDAAEATAWLEKNRPDVVLRGGDPSP